ncbi:MAG: bifunctional 23S rRNA (guanine(2069)-N(7))-methyltransferase RlmK/23S rRNA (guanine(2445)-N(2))-methyltransferase RlmL [Sphaerochaetaceae bacterium]
MVFFVTSAQYVNDIISEEVAKAGGTNISSFSGGVEFTGDLKCAYTFCLSSHVATRMMLGLYEEDGVESSDDLYAASVEIPWEQWVTPEKTFAITETVKHTDWLRNSHFAAIRLKDAIVDRIRNHFDQRRPVVDTDNPDVVFHIHLDADHVQWYVDFSGRALYKRGYRRNETEAVLSEYLASAVLYRSDWYKAMQSGDDVPVLFDPFCGSGTLPIEAALYATDTAPGIVNPKKTFAFEKLPIHDAALWETCKKEALVRSETGRKKDIRIFAWDVDKEAVNISKENAKAAGMDKFISFGVQDFTDISADDVPAEKGYVVTDPPYGIRLDENDTPYSLLYQKIGDQFSQLFLGWHISILCGDQRLLSNIDMKPNRTNSFINGGIPCQFAHYYVFSAEEKAELIAKAQKRREERLAQPLSEGAQMAYNRLKKNLEYITPLMKEQGVSCYRIYDADMPEYSAAIDLYENTWISLQEYEAPEDIPEEDAQRRLDELVDATERATGIDREKIYVKTRSVQSGNKQYIKFADTSKYYIANENGAKYLVNFTDYLDTGLFLDHRPLRARIAQMANGKRFCNLFCYTGSATVQAAKGGALSTVSVDSSSTYLDWAQQNMRLNRFTTMNHFFYRADCMKFLYDTWDRYDLIFCDPPTYSNSKSRGSFDIQRDHIDLIKACMMHLDQNGVLIFSTNYRRFKMAPFLYEDWDIQDITPETIGDDFARDPRIHSCFLIRKRLEVNVVKPVVKKVVLKRNADKA